MNFIPSPPSRPLLSEDARNRLVDRGSTAPIRGCVPVTCLRGETTAVALLASRAVSASGHRGQGEGWAMSEKLKAAIQRWRQRRQHRKQRGRQTQATTSVQRPPGWARDVPVSATLAANEAVAARRARGRPVYRWRSARPGSPCTRCCGARSPPPARPTATARWPGIRRCGRLRPGTGPGAALPTTPDQVVCGPGGRAVVRAAAGDRCRRRPPPGPVGSATPPRRP